MHHSEILRRRFLACFSSLGLGSTLLPGILWARLQEEKQLRVNSSMIAEAEKLAGLELTEQERELMLEDLNEQLEAYESLRTVTIANEVPPALQFQPLLPLQTIPRGGSIPEWVPEGGVERPADLEQVAFWPVTRLAALLRTGQVTSLELTQMYLKRLKTYGPKLECVITLTEELALKQANRADAEMRSRKYRGPLHGIPWGAKDLLAVRGYRTTWGAVPYQDQTLEENATVFEKLEQAGAVLVAKLTLGALAWGDVWFGGKTLNPWNLEQGSSGSSAGSASATAAGLVGFSIGSETWGSIVSPCTRCGATGLRPTFGRVSRHGAMALSWSMDKLGPICRSVEDCALVFSAIHGADGKDPVAVSHPFQWDSTADVSSLRVGFLKSAFEAERENKEWKKLDQAVLEELGRLGLNLRAMELPDYPIDAMAIILNSEAAAAFDELTRSNRDDLLVRQERRAWPNALRQARFTPAVEYIQANRLRTLTMRAMNEIMADLDAYVAPTFGGSNVLLTNLTGHPCVVLPNGFTSEGVPTSITFIGKLFGEAALLSLAAAYQRATGFHLRHPPLFQASAASAG